MAVAVFDSDVVHRPSIPQCHVERTLMDKPETRRGSKRSYAELVVIFIMNGLTAGTTKTKPASSPHSAAQHGTAQT